DHVPQMYEQRDARRDRHEQAHLNRHPRTSQPRHQHEAGPDTAESDEGRQNGRLRHGLVPDMDERAGPEGSHGTAWSSDHDRPHLTRPSQEIDPSTRSSTPLAISTWLSTGNVGKSRSMIMRT